MRPPNFTNNLAVIYEQYEFQNPSFTSLLAVKDEQLNIKFMNDNNFTEQVALKDILLKRDINMTEGCGS